MEKGPVFVFCAFVGAAVAAVACSSSDSSTFGPSNENKDAEAPPISPLVPDGSADAQAEAGPTSCPPSIPADFKPSWTAPNKQSACSTEEIDGYWTACLADPSKKDTCAAWTKDHAACTTCIEPADGSGPIQWHLDRLYYSSNIAGCLAIEQGDGSAGSCGDAYNAAVQCGRAACEGCLTAGGTFDQFGECQRAVQTQGVCKSYQTVESNKCQNIKAADAGTLSCFKTTNEDNPSYFKRLEAIFCGP